MLEQSIDFILKLTEGMGYGGIVFLMAIESSFFPLPSELVIPPAGYLVQQGQMSFWLVVLSGVVGSWLGALVNYFLAVFLGRKIIYKLAGSTWSRFFFLSPDKVKKTEDFFLLYGRSSTFFGRLIPVIRHLISLPAGFSKMNIFSFSFYTLFGSAIWVIILTILGYFLGANQVLLENNLRIISYFLVVLAVVAAIMVWIFNRKKID